MKASFLILYLLWITWNICLVKSECNIGQINEYSVTASSETTNNSASGVFTDKGWCAGPNPNSPWLDVDFTTGFGVKSFTLSRSNIDGTSFPKTVLVQYVLQEGSNLSNIQLTNGPLVLQLNETTGNSTINLSSGFAAKKLRFTLQSYSGKPCMKLRIAGCRLEDLCQPACNNGGICVAENQCHCVNSFQGVTCEQTPCNPEILGVFDGRIPQRDIVVSSQDPKYPKSELGLDPNNLSLNEGWCAASYDQSPWLQIKLDEPKSLSTFYFSYINEQGTLKKYMESFDLQYISPTDSSRIFLTFAEDIPSLNGTHATRVTIYPSIVTDTIRIVSHSKKERTCFKFELVGCDPKGLCQSNWCLNGGSCVGENICKCPSGFIGNRCDKNSTDISTPRIAFLNITNNQLLTTLFTFNVFGNVVIQLVNKTNVVVINGTESNIKLEKNIAGSECLINLNKCQNGFTLSIDVNFGSLVDNTYIVSSGGDKPDHTGLALLYAHKTLTYIVTTSTQTWRLTVAYIPVLKEWQKIEITLNTNLGIGLFINGNLLGTRSRPDPASATQTSQLCIGCNPGQTTNVRVDMQISHLQLWSVSRTELVNVGIVKAPIVTTRRPLQTSHSATQTQTAKPTTMKTTATTSKTNLLTTSGRGFEIYNMTITGLFGNILITPAFNFTVYGKPKLELENNSNTALLLDCSKYQYVELADKSIPCLQDLDKCDKGYTFNIEVNFKKIDLFEKTYILSSGGDGASQNGMAVYLHGNLLTYGVKKGIWHWASSTNIQSIIKVNTWYKFEISWSEANGILVLIDGFEVLKTSEATPAPESPKTNPVLIGKAPNSTYTSCMAIRNLYTWTVERETLVTSGILQAPKKPVNEMTTKAGQANLTPYDLTFLRIDENQIVFTQNFLFQGHGQISLPPSGGSIITLQGSANQYLTLLNRSIVCLDLISHCNAGFSIEISLQVFIIKPNEKMYIYSSIIENKTGGVYFFYENEKLFFGFNYEKSMWSGSVEYDLVDFTWHSFILSWSKEDGIILFENFKPISQHITPTNTTFNATNIGNFLIGRGNGRQNAVFQINKVRIWPYSMGFLIENKIFTTATPSTSTQLTTATSPDSTVTTKNNKPWTQFIHLAILGISGTTIFTSSYNITVYGSVSLVPDHSGQQIIRIVMSNASYLEINDSEIPCLSEIIKCRDEFALSLDIRIIKIDNSSRIDFISKTLSLNSIGILLFYQSHELHFEVTDFMSQKKWMGTFTFTFTLNTWNTVQFIWSDAAGVSIYVNDTLVYEQKNNTFEHVMASSYSILKIGTTVGGTINGTFEVKNIGFGASTTSNYESSTQTTHLPRQSSVIIQHVPTSTPHTIENSSSSESKNWHELTTSLPSKESTVTTVFETPLLDNKNTFLFLNITENKIYSDKSILMKRGDVEIVTTEYGAKLIKLILSRGSYLKLDTTNTSCLLSYIYCREGLSVAMNISVLDIHIDQTVLFFSNIGNKTSLPQLYLYYFSHKLYFGGILGGKIWSASVSYLLDLNHWHDFKLTFIKEYGLWLYVDNKLLSFVGEHTVFSSSLLKNLEIVQGFVIGQSFGIYNTTILIGGINIMSTNSYQINALKPNSIFFNESHPSGVIIHGQSEVVDISSSQNAIKLNGSKGSYIEIDSGNDSCLNSPQFCVDGFSVEVGINLISMKNNSKVYLILIERQHERFYLYFQNQVLYLGLLYNSSSMAGRVLFEVKTGEWNTYLLSWSKTVGLNLYINNKLVGHAIESFPSVSKLSDNKFSIGKSNVSYGALIVTKVQIWQLSFDLLVQYGLKTLLETTKTSSTQTTSGLRITELEERSTQKLPIGVFDTTTNQAVSKHKFNVTSSGPTVPYYTRSVRNITSMMIDGTSSLFESTFAVITKPTKTDVNAPKITMTTPIKLQVTTQKQEHKSTPITVTHKPTTMPQGVNNFLFLNITGNQIHTSQFTLAAHGHIEVVKSQSGENVVKLNASTGGFLQIDSSQLDCFNPTRPCENGITVGVNINIVSISYNQTLYIMTSISDSNLGSFYLYHLNNKLYFGSKFRNITLTASVGYNFTLNTWHSIQISISESYNTVGLVIDGRLLKYVSMKTTTNHYPTFNITSLTIGRTTYTDIKTTVLVGGIQVLPKVSQALVERISISEIVKTAKSTTKTTASTTSTPKPTTSIPTTTQQPIPIFHWNLTNVPSSNTIIGQIFNLTIYGFPIKTTSGINFQNTSQYIEFGQIKCLLDPRKCALGLTIQFMINLKFTSENTFILTSGGELPNGMGVAIIYRYGLYQFVLTTTTKSWYANCGKDILTANTFHTVMLTWKESIGLEIIIDNKQVEISTIAVNHQASLANSVSVYFGKQPATTIKYEYVLQTVSIWYAHVDLLVIEGLCPKPERPEKPKPTTTIVPKTTLKPTSSTVSKFTGIISTKPPQCPAGCVSIGQSTAKPVVTATSKPPATDKPSPTTKQTPSSTRQTQPSTKQTTPTTTERGAPNYSTSLTITSTVSKTDNNAYLVCAFRKTDEPGIEMTVALIIENTRVLVTTVSGTEGIASFAVSQVNRDLYGKRIHCSLVANYVGSSHSTHVFISNTYIPKFTVTPTKITVTEGQQGKFVTIQSTAPPHLYCCTGCKGQCQVHVVGTFIYNRKDTRCSYNYISQAVIESSKPPNYNKDICGFVLTNTNWKNENQILVVATLDNRRDGTQKRDLKIIVNVYNQPPTVQITDMPITHALKPHVEVTIKDNYHSPYTCKSINDPHMLTFDGSHYNNMNEGQFVMFKHRDLPFEVRTWYHKCSKRSHATCNCGVAIKSGDDVISVIGCHTITSGGHHGHGHGIGLIFQQLFGHLSSKDEFAKTPMTIQIYKNGELTLGTYIRRYGCGQKYEIQLPTGMIITVQQSYKPFINVWIKASSYDWEKSSGLCGNYNGKRDEWKNGAGLTAFIKSCIAPNGPFFNGVGASALTTGSVFCSCVENKGSVCSPGLGVMLCTRSRYDITQTLIRQAKSPILTSNRQKRQVETTDETLTITQDNTTMSLDEARDECHEVITNSSVTISCQPLLSNLSQQIENCAYDYQAMGNFAFASSTLSDIVADCVDTANALIANNDTETNDTTTIDIPDNLDTILDSACLENCGQNGECREGVCECKEGYTGDRCEISQDTKPTISSIPVLCDVTNTLDCTGAVVYGNNFVNSTKITCHFEYVEVTDNIVKTAQSGTIPATFISINQVVCLIPQLRSTEIRISNNGQTLSDASSPHVVYDSGCFDCSIRNETVYMPYCTRKNNNCVIDGNCYKPGSYKQGDVCSVCSPAINNTEWSFNREKIECTAKPVAMTSSTNKDDENKIIALAVVSGVLAAILLLLIFYIVRSRSTSRSKKEFGEYEVTPENKLHRDEPYKNTTMNNPIYGQENEKL